VDRCGAAPGSTKVHGLTRSVDTGISDTGVKAVVPRRGAPRSSMGRRNGTAMPINWTRPGSKRSFPAHRAHRVLGLTNHPTHQAIPKRRAYSNVWPPTADSLLESLGPPRRVLMAPPLRFIRASTTPRAWSPSRQVQSGHLPSHPTESPQLSCLDMFVARSVLLWSRRETQTTLPAEVKNSHRSHIPDLHPGGLSESDKAIGPWCKSQLGPSLFGLIESGPFSVYWYTG